MALPEPTPDAREHSNRVAEHIRGEIAASGGWISFARYMELALYAPGLGYYSAGARKLGKAGDFVTAPEISPLYGQTLARQVKQVLEAGFDEVLEEGGVGVRNDRLGWSWRLASGGPLAAARPLKLPEGFRTEIQQAAQGFMRSLAQVLEKGVAFFVDYGFPQKEYYHPQRKDGTL